MKKIEELQYIFYNLLNINKPMIISDEEEDIFNNTIYCYYCNKSYIIIIKFVITII